MPIKQMAYALNFDKISQFGRYFKRQEEMGHKEYRLKNKVKHHPNERHVV